MPNLQRSRSTHTKFPKRKAHTDDIDQANSPPSQSEHFRKRTNRRRTQHDLPSAEAKEDRRRRLRDGRVHWRRRSLSLHRNERCRDDSYLHVTEKQSSSFKCKKSDAKLLDVSRRWRSLTSLSIDRDITFDDTAVKYRRVSAVDALKSTKISAVNHDTELDLKVRNNTMRNVKSENKSTEESTNLNIAKSFNLRQEGTSKTTGKISSQKVTNTKSTESESPSTHHHVRGRSNSVDVRKNSLCPKKDRTCASFLGLTHRWNSEPQVFLELPLHADNLLSSPTSSVILERKILLANPEHMAVYFVPLPEREHCLLSTERS